MSKIIYISRPDDDIEEYRFADEYLVEECTQCGEPLTTAELDCEREVCLECYLEREK